MVELEKNAAAFAALSSYSESSCSEDGGEDAKVPTSGKSLGTFDF